MKSKNLTNILLYAAVGILLFGSGYKIGEFKTLKQRNVISGYSFKNASNANNNVDFALFWDTWQKVEDKFVDKKKIDEKKMYYGAIKGMVASLEDPYTFFLTPDENKQSKDDLGGKFEGIGAQLGLKEGRIVIVAPLKNSPAEKAGLKSSDVIEKVDGQSTKGWTLGQAVSKIRGEKGTKVKLGILRQQQTREFTITRDQIQVSSVELNYEKKNNDQVAHLRVNQFGDDTNDEWDKAVEDIQSKWKKNEIKGIVLDLRDNPGGYLDSSVYLAAEFLPETTVVVKQESTVHEDRVYTVERKGKLLDIPVTVLVNQGSASASEILAGALRDHKRATLVGEKSFGKGSVQEALDLDNGAGLHVTVAKWILPNGDWINGKGIDPEIKITNEVKEGNTLTKEDDKQLEKAIELVLK